MLVSLYSPVVSSTLLFISNSDKFVQFLNAYAPIEATFSGITTDSIFTFPSKALLAIAVALDGITTFVLDPLYFVIVFPFHVKSDSAVSEPAPYNSCASTESSTTLVTSSVVPCTLTLDASSVFTSITVSVA